MRSLGIRKLRDTGANAQVSKSRQNHPFNTTASYEEGDAYACVAFVMISGQRGICFPAAAMHVGRH